VHDRGSWPIASAEFLPLVHGCAALLHAVFLCFSFFDVLGFLEPLIFLEITLEVFLSIKAQGFPLKRRQNAFLAQCEAKEGNLTLTQLNLT